MSCEDWHKNESLKVKTLTKAVCISLHRKQEQEKKAFSTLKVAIDFDFMQL